MHFEFLSHILRADTFKGLKKVTLAVRVHESAIFFIILRAATEQELCLRAAEGALPFFCSCFLCTALQ